MIMIMKIKLKSKLWVWLHCKRDMANFWLPKTHSPLVRLSPLVFSHAGEVVDAILTDKSALDDLSDAAYAIEVEGYKIWVPNWFISEVYDD